MYGETVTATMTKSLVRPATALDDLAALLGGYTLGLNYAQVLVVDGAGQIDGMLVLFDGGHEQIRVDHLQVLPDAPQRTGALLIEGLYTYCRAHGIQEVVYCTPSPEFAMLAVARRGAVSCPMFTVKLPVPKE